MWTLDLEFKLLDFFLFILLEVNFPSWVHFNCFRHLSHRINHIKCLQSKRLKKRIKKHKLLSCSYNCQKRIIKHPFEFLDITSEILDNSFRFQDFYFIFIVIFFCFVILSVIHACFKSWLSGTQRVFLLSCWLEEIFFRFCCHFWFVLEVHVLGVTFF